MGPTRAWPRSSRSSCRARAPGRTSSTSPSTRACEVTSFTFWSSAPGIFRSRPWRTAGSARAHLSLHAERGEALERAGALQKNREARQAKGPPDHGLGKAIGTKDTMYIAAALHGQHRLNAEEAKKL